MRNRRQNFAVERNELARAARPLGELVSNLAKVRHSAGDGGVPPVPVVAPPKKKRKRAKKQDREATVLHDCLKYLHEKGYYCWRQNTGTLFVGGQPVSFGHPGAGDITGILPDGRRLEVECKSPTGRQSAKQKEFQRQIEINNGVYILARSVDDLKGRL